MAGGSKKLPVSLTLHVDYTDIEATAILVSSSFYDSPGVNVDGADKEMIFCNGMLRGRTAIHEAAIMRQNLPLNSHVEYYQPSHDANPTKFGAVNDDGEDLSVDGVWACVFRAPNLSHLAMAWDAFVRHFMGVGQPVRDNFFRHGGRTQRFITRRNNVNGNVWETRYRFKLQIKGSVTNEVHNFAMKMMSAHTWLQWGGRFMCDPLKVMGDLKCDCKNETEINLAYDKFLAARSTAVASATADDTAATAQPQHSSDAAPTTPKPFDSKKAEVGSQTPPKLPSPNRVTSLTATSKETSKAPPASPPSGPLFAYPDWKSKLPPSWPGNNTWPASLPINVTVAENKNKEGQEAIEDGDAEGCSPQSTECDGAPEEELESAAKRLKQNPKDELSNEDKKTVADMIKHCHQFATDKYPALCQALVHTSDFARLQALPQLFTEMHNYTKNDVMFSKEEAQNFVTTLVEFFQFYPPAEDIIVNFKEWLHGLLVEKKNAEPAQLTKEQFFHQLSQACDNDWDANKVDLIRQEDMTTIARVLAVRTKLDEWCSASLDNPLASDAEVLHELQKLPDFCRHWASLTAVLSSANLSFDQLRSRTNLSFEELAQAGQRQQDLHLLNAIPLALQDDVKHIE